MDELVDHLEKSIQTLVQEQALLKHENSKLHKIKLALMREKDLLSAKHKQAVAQIEKMISRLKFLEKSV